MTKITSARVLIKRHFKKITCLCERDQYNKMSPKDSVITISSIKTIKKSPKAQVNDSESRQEARPFFIVTESQMVLKVVEETDQQNCLPRKPQCTPCAVVIPLKRTEKKNLLLIGSPSTDYVHRGSRHICRPMGFTLSYDE